MRCKYCGKEVDYIITHLLLSKKCYGAAIGEMYKNRTSFVIIDGVKITRQDLLA